MADDERYISGADTLSRLVRLETKMCLKFEEMDKALNLATGNSEKEKIYTRDQIAEHFKVVNNFQARMDKLSESFAIKKNVDKDIYNLKELIDDKVQNVTKTVNANTKLLYVGIGIVLTLQVMFKFFIG